MTMKKYQNPATEVVQTLPVHIICDSLNGQGAFAPPAPPSESGDSPNAAPWRF